MIADKPHPKPQYQTASKNRSHDAWFDFCVSPKKIQRRPWKNIKQGFSFSKEIWEQETNTQDTGAR